MIFADTTEWQSSYLPNVPTIAELGYPGYESIYWLGIVGPAGMPADVVATLEKVMLDICKDPDFIKDMTDRDVDVQGQSAKGLRVEIDNQIAKWKTVIEQAKVQAQ